MGIPASSELMTNSEQNAFMYSASLIRMRLRWWALGRRRQITWLSPCPSSDATAPCFFAASDINSIVTRVHPFCLSPSSHPASTAPCRGRNCYVALRRSRDVSPMSLCPARLRSIYGANDESNDLAWKKFLAWPGFEPRSPHFPFQRVTTELFRFLNIVILKLYIHDIFLTWLFRRTRIEI